MSIGEVVLHKNGGCAWGMAGDHKGPLIRINLRKAHQML
jgi:hypothetical protein